jgi:hypothetical protein
MLKRDHRHWHRGSAFRSFLTVERTMAGHAQHAVSIDTPGTVIAMLHAESRVSLPKEIARQKSIECNARPGGEDRLRKFRFAAFGHAGLSARTPQDR